MAVQITSKKKALVLWSGGFDSTSLVFYYLNEGYKVFVLPAVIQNNKCQMAAEKAARCSMMNIFQRDNLPVVLLDECKFDLHLNSSTSEGVTQPILWLTTLFFNIGSYENYDVVGFGYVKNDDFWHYKHSFLETWKNMLGFRHDKEQHIKIEFPFEWDTKEKIARNFWYGKQDYFQFLSSSETGRHFSIDKNDCDPKNKELRELWEVVKSINDDSVKTNLDPTTSKGCLSSDILLAIKSDDPLDLSVSTLTGELDSQDYPLESAFLDISDRQEKYEHKQWVLDECKFKHLEIKETLPKDNEFIRWKEAEEWTKQVY